MFEVHDETEILHVVEAGENNDTIDQNDTVVEIESSEEQVTSRGPAQSDENRNHRHEKKKSEAELLKTSLYNDLGLYFNDVMKGKIKKHEPPKDLHVDHISRERKNIIWVNPLFPSEAEYEPMSDEDRNPFIRKVLLMVCFNLIMIIVAQLLVLNETSSDSFCKMAEKEIELEGRNIWFTMAILSFIITITIGSYLGPFVAGLFKGTLGMILGVTGIVLMTIADYIIMYDCGKHCPCTGIAWVLAVIGPCLLIAWFVVRVEVMELVIAFVATLAVVILCLGLACTSFDFTKYALYVAVIGMVLSVFSLAYFLMRFIFKIKVNAFKLVLSCGWALYHSLSLIIEIQMVIGGHTLEIDASQFILGGVLITLSIVQIFLSFLKIVMAARD